MSRWRWLLTQLTRRLSWRASLIGFMGVAAAVIAAFAERFIPWDLPYSIDASSVLGILTIMASSMLAVTTFSLSVMISAFGAATSNVTPRATKLLMEDSTTQNVLSTFIGAFLFSMVGIVLLETGVYGESGHLVLFFFTVTVIVLIVISLLRWINQLTLLGRVGETTDRVENATLKAINQRLDMPYLGGQRLDTQYLAKTYKVPVRVDCVGYVQNVDMHALNALSAHLEIDISLCAIPGCFVYPHTNLLYLHTKPGEELHEHHLHAAQHAFTVAKERTYDQDPRFGLAVMSEIGSRALSSAINDPGTAIDILGRLTRLMAAWSRGRNLEHQAIFPRIFVPPLSTADLFEDAFALMARDGAGLIEVQLRLQKNLHALAKMGDTEFRTAALEMAEVALLRAEQALPFERDRLHLRRVVETL